MKSRIRIFSIFIALILGSCASQQALITVTPTNTLAPSATINPQSTITRMPYPAVTPEITATPIPFNPGTQDLRQMIADTYHRSASCLAANEYAMPNNVTGSVEPEFVDVADEVDNPVEIYEIADNTKNTYRAYLAACKTYWDCKWGPNQLHLENILNGRTYMITWKGFESITAHWNLIWIGENIIAYMHMLDPRREEIIAINVKTKEFAYIAQAWAYCVTH